MFPCIAVSIICRLQTADRTGYKMQTEDKMQTGGELGIFHKFPQIPSHVIALVDNINVEATTIFERAFITTFRNVS